MGRCVRTKKEAAMTIRDIESMTRSTITPAQAGAILGIDPNTIRWQARDNPAALGFPVIVVKSRTYIPRLPFIQFMTEMGGANDKATD